MYLASGGFAPDPTGAQPRWGTSVPQTSRTHPDFRAWLCHWSELYRHHESRQMLVSWKGAIYCKWRYTRVTTPKSKQLRHRAVSLRQHGFFVFLQRMNIFCKCFSMLNTCWIWEVVTRKIKQLRQSRRLPARICRGRKNVVKCFVLHVTTSYLQHVFNMLKRAEHLQKCFRAVDFLRLCRGRKHVKMFYFTCNHFLSIISSICFQRAKTFAKVFCKCFATFLQMF